jgi:hypothetical protein
MGKKEPSYTASGNVNEYNYYGRQYGGSSKTKNKNAKYDPAMPL